MHFTTDPSTPVKNMMTHKNLVTVRHGTDAATARELLHQHRIEKLLVVDDHDRCIGLITVKDMDKSEAHPLAIKDGMGRLRCAAAIGVGDDGLRRAAALIEAGVDVMVVDTAHGHSAGVLHTVAALRDRYPEVQIIGGNIATPETAIALAKAGAKCAKIGIGPGSICTTRVVAGVGVPQFSAVMETALACHENGVSAIADGGVSHFGRYRQGDRRRGRCGHVGSLLAGCEESRGRSFSIRAVLQKLSRHGIVWRNGAWFGDRYFQQEVKDALKLVPEGIEGQVPLKGWLWPPLCISSLAV